MIKIQIVLLALLLFTVASCQKVMFCLSGIKQPQIEDRGSITEYLKNLKIDTSDVYCLDTNLFKQINSSSFKPGWKPGFRPVQIRCYDSNGKPVMQWASCEGYLKDLKTFDSVPPKNANGLDTSLTLEEDLSRYFTLDGEPANLRPEPGYDYYFLVYFARFFPKMTRGSFREVYDYSRQHPGLRMKVYKIDTDVLDFWGDSLKLDVELH